MTIALWLLTYLLHSTVAYGCAVVAAHFAEELSLRETIWRAAALLPLVSATLASWSQRIVIAVGTTESAAVGGAAGSRIDTTNVIVAAWIGIAALLLLRDWMARSLFVRSLGTRLPAEKPAAEILKSLCAAANVKRPVRLTISQSTHTAVALSRSEICIPSRAIEELSTRELKAMLAHEVAHLIRKDYLWLQVLASLTSVLFPQPLHWVAGRALRRISERASDRWAADHTGDPMALAACIVEAAGWCRSAPAAVAGMRGRGDISERIESLIRQVPGTHKRANAIVPLAFLGAALSVVPSVAMPLPQRHAAPTSPPANSQSQDFMAGFEAGRRYRASPDSASSYKAEREKAVEQRSPHYASATMPLRRFAADRAAIERQAVGRSTSR